MMLFAEHHFRNASTLSDGAQAHDHAASAQRQLAQMPGRTRPPPSGPLIPAGPPFPEPLDYLWDLFHEISFGMPVNGMTPPTISWDTLQAWHLLTDTPLDPWESQTIVRLSMMRAGIQSENRANQTRATEPPKAPPSKEKRSR